jgi:hypothetical protein
MTDEHPDPQAHRPAVPSRRAGRRDMRASKDTPGQGMVVVGKIFLGGFIGSMALSPIIPIVLILLFLPLAYGLLFMLAAWILLLSKRKKAARVCLIAGLLGLLAGFLTVGTCAWMLKYW